MRMRIQSLSSVALGLLLAAPTLGQGTVDANWSDRFNVPGLLNRVFASGVWQGELVAGGQNFEVRGARIGHLARFDGVDWHEFAGGVQGLVRAVAEFRGDLVVAGEVGLAGGRAVNSIARYDGTSWHALGSGVSAPWGTGEVFDLAVFRDQLYVGGHFHTAGGQPAVGLARWDGATWHTLPAGGVQGSSAPKVLALEVHNDRLYVGGEFDRAGGVTARNIAVYDGNTFAPLGAGLGGLIQNGVHSLAAYQGRIHAGGVFRSSGSTTVLKVARWDGSQWSPLGLGIPDWTISVGVHALHAYAGRLWVGGNFVRVDAQSTGAGIPARALASWDGNAWYGHGGVEGSDLATTVITLCDWNDRLIAGGEFAWGGDPLRIGDAVVSNSVVAFDPVGGDYGQLGQGLGGAGGKILRFGDGLVAVGGFREAGRELTPMVALFDGHDWRSLGEFRDGQAKDAVVFQGKLHVCGTFRYVQGRRITGSVVRYEGGGQWTELGFGGETLAVHNGELWAGGTGGFHKWLGGTSWSSLVRTYGSVLTMRSFQGDLFVGGTTMSWQGQRASLFAWDGSTLRMPGGSPVDDTVYALHERNGELLVGGDFDNAAGVSAPRAAVWDGARFRPLVPAGIGGSSVRCFAELGGALYLGGDLGRFWNSNPNWIGRFDGQALQPLGSDLDGMPFAMLGDPDSGELWISGGFTQAGRGKPSRGLAVWHTRPRWEDLAGAAPGPRRRPLLEGFGALRQGGSLHLRAAGLPDGGPAAWVFGTSTVDRPLGGGILVPSADVAFTLPAGPLGQTRITLPISFQVPTGARLIAQVWAVDPATNALRATNAVQQQR